MGYNCTRVDVLRSVHIFDIVLFDIVFVFIGGILLGKIIYFYGVADLYRKVKTRNIVICVIILMLYCIGIFTHYILNVDTMLNFKLGISAIPNRHSECKLL
jgi:hypothetical protein